VRSDYKYVDRATAIVLCVTAKGKECLASFADRPERLQTDSRAVRMRELLLALNEEYVEVKEGEGWMEWYREYALQFRQGAGRVTDVSWNDFRDALLDELISVRKVIWDDVRYKKGRRAYQLFIREKGWK